MNATYGQRRYRVIAPLGSGAFAEVLEVEDTRLGVRRALKVLRAELTADPVARARFAAEAQVMARLSHPHLVAVTDVGEDRADDGSARVWLVMELLPGGTLAERVARRGAIAPEEAVRAMLGVIDGVALAHRSGVIHRDIKPANLLFDAEGRLKLGDFGIAQLCSLDDLTRTGVALGSWAFMAPEQRLDPRGVGPASDVYGLAATLVWMIHGGPVSDLHVSEHRARLLVNVPDRIAGALSRALAFRAEERFYRVDAFGEMLAIGIDGTEEYEVLGRGGAAPPQRPPVAHGPLSTAGPSSAGTSVTQRSRLAAGAFMAALATVSAAALALTWNQAPAEVARLERFLAIPTCPDSPTRWSHRYLPRWETSVPGGREAGGGIATDIDQDGHADLLFVHALEEEFRIYWGTGADLDDAPTRIRADRMTQGIARTGDAGDLDGDGIVDLVGVALENSGFIISMGEGARRFGLPRRIDSGEVPYEVRVTDWDRDGKADILFTTSASPVKRLRWRRARSSVEFDTVSDLYDGVWSFDVVPATTRIGTDLVILTESDLLVAQRTSTNRLKEVRPILTGVPLQPVDQVRVLPSGDALLWSAGATTGRALRVSLATGESCRFDVPRETGIQDIQDVDRDGIVDAIILRTCSYCTSSYKMLLGER